FRPGCMPIRNHVLSGQGARECRSTPRPSRWRTLPPGHLGPCRAEHRHDGRGQGRCRPHPGRGRPLLWGGAVWLSRSAPHTPGLPTTPRDYTAGGCGDTHPNPAPLTSRAASARDAAIALVQGTPMRTDIEQIASDMIGPATDAAAKALAQFEGPDGFTAPMSAHLVTATK